MSLLQVKNLSTKIGYGDLTKTIVNDISFNIERGETVALVGESGSGKSMTAYSIMRLLPHVARVSNGSVLFNGNEKQADLLRIQEAQMRDFRGPQISMIFQEPMSSFNPVMTIGDQIIESLVHASPDSDKRQLNEEVYELLELVGIRDPQRSAHEYPHQFSGGMLQRAMIAMALAGKPELLIADEPTTALDVTIQSQVLDLLKSIQEQRQMALMLVTHDLGIVKQMADRVLVMRHGELIEQNDSATFYANPQHDYSKALFAALPSFEKRGSKLQSTSTEQIAKSESFEATKIDTARTILDINNLKTWYPIKKGILKRTIGHVKAVDGVSLSINEGETVALVGESGSGKSTLARSIVGLEQTHSGSITFNDFDLTLLSNKEMREQLEDIQFIFQDPYSSMNPRMRVLEIVSEGIKALGKETSPIEIEKQVSELLRITGLPEDSLYRYPHEFSGGQRQRICIARALAVKPKLLICDEPTSALDVSIQAQILNLLEQLQQELGLAYLFISHDMGVVSYIADKIAVMKSGKLVEYGTTEQILLNPKNEYTQELMDAVPKI